MNIRQITLVQESFARVAPIADAAADLFYARLFELAPALRPMFPTDLIEQKRKLMTTLTLVVNGLTRLEALAPAVQALGRRHAGYGVKPEHYQTVAEALLWTLEQGLGEAFTPGTKDAWVAAYTLLAQTMIAAAEESAALTAPPVVAALAPAA
ncbi:MAG TPA: globin family protein [Anaerolineales bacterium]|nr:globin family protein [Anaerolineales bacterium]